MMVSRKSWVVMTVSALQVLSSLVARAAQPAAPAPAPAASAAPQRLFPILEFQVEGNTMLSRVEVERAVMPYMGIKKSIKDVDAARQNLEKVYHGHGYQTVLVNIPPQEVSAGIVRLAVVEASVARLEIKGSRYHSLPAIRSTLAQLAPGVTPDFNAVQKQLADVNRSEDLKVTPVVRASTTPGKIDVDLDVEDQLPLHGELELNNRYSANTAQLRLIADASYGNLFQTGQSVSVQYQVAPQNSDNAQIGSISYVIPTQNGPVFALYAVKSDSNIAAIGALDVIGKGDIYGLRMIEPLESTSPTFYHNFTAGIDYKDFQQEVQLQGDDAVESPARYAPFLLDYNATWLGGGPAPNSTAAPAATLGGRSSTSFEASVSFLVRAIGGTDASQFAVKRYDADPNYIILRPSLMRQQVIFGDWSLVGKVDGQVASGPLISNEQYAGGGVDSVRGYTEAERLGDNGARVSLELRTPQLLLHASPHFEQSFVFVFADAAWLQSLDPLPDQVAAYHLASYGLGFRIKWRGLSMDLDGAHAISEGYVTLAGSYSAQFRTNYAW
jgi:hemolysin activation/secretion protein